jgi:hypothetical protein
MLRLIATAALALALVSSATAQVFVGPQAHERALEIVRNGDFDAGGRSYASGWQRLPGTFRIHRTEDEVGGHSLFLKLREDGEAGVVQTVQLPPRRALSLRLLATCHTSTEAAVVATLTRLEDGLVLAEVTVDGIERGTLAQGFDSGRGGPAELMLRLVGDAGSSALIDRVAIARPVQACEARPPDFSGLDLLLAQGQGLRVDADFEPRLLPQAARMLQEALEDLTGARTTEIGAGVFVSVAQPEATVWPEREAYHLTVCETGVTIRAAAEEGAFRGLMTLIDLIRAEPSGGARILAVDVEDRPGLRWRVADGPVGAEIANTARAIARLKLNMALVDPRREDAAALVSELRAVAVEPVLMIAADEADDITGAMQDAIERLGARYLLVEEPSDAVRAFAQRHAREVTVLRPAESVDGWPARRLVALDGAGPGSGALIPWQTGSQATQQLADQAWRGMPVTE